MAGLQSETRRRDGRRVNTTSDVPRGMWVGILIALVLVGIAARGAWSPVGASLKEEATSIVFGMRSAGMYNAFMGTTHFGVYYNLGNLGTGIWTNWQQTGLNESLLQGAGVTCLATTGNFGADNLLLAGTSNGQVYWTTDILGPWLVWYQATGLPTPAEGGEVRNLVYDSYSGIFFACTTKGLYFSTNSGQLFSLWPQQGDIGTARVTDLALHPNQMTGVFWVCTESEGTTSGGLYKWNGSSWDDLSTFLPAGVYSFAAVAVSNESSPDPLRVWVGDTNGHGLLQTNPLAEVWENRCVNCEQILDIEVPTDYSTFNEHIVFGTETGWWDSALVSGVGTVCKLRNPQGLAIHKLTPHPTYSTLNRVWAAATSDGPKWVSKDTYPADFQGDKTSLLDISQLVPSPNSPSDGMLFGVSRRYGLFVSADLGQTFQLRMPSFQSASSPAGLDTPATALALQPGFDGSGNPCDNGRGTLFLAFDGRGVFKSTDVGYTWSPVNAGPSTFDLHVNALVHTPTVSSSPLFAGLASSASVFRFDVSGSSGSWVKLEFTPPPPIPGTKIICLGMPPSHGSAELGNVFVGTDAGLYLVGPTGSSWSDDLLPGSGPVTAVVFDPNYNGSTNRTMFATRYGLGIYKKSCVDTPTCSTWAWTKVSIDSMNLKFTALAISPFYSAGREFLAAGTSDLASPTAGGVYISLNGGASWVLSNGGTGAILSDVHVQSLAFLKRTTVLSRLTCGTRREKAWLSDSLTSPLWGQSAGFGTDPPEVRAMAVSPVPGNTGCPENSSYPHDAGGDVFTGGIHGVSWSNDGGETFRPINQGFAGMNVCPPVVNCLLVVNYYNGCPTTVEGGTAGVRTPVLLAGTQGRGIWYRCAVQSPGWDWTGGVWMPSNLTSGNIRSFTRDDLSTFMLWASGDDGAWVSTNGGVTWTPMNGGLPTGAAMPDIQFSQMYALTDAGGGPKAPSGGAIWGTVGYNGVYRGTETTFAESANAPLAFRWDPRNGSGVGTLANLDSHSVIQLSPTNVSALDKPLLAGMNASGGVYRSPDEGVAWWEPSGIGLESICGDVTDFLEACNGDVLCSVDAGASTCGGVFLSGDRGRHWVNITQDLPSQDLSSIVADRGCPPSYYGGTFAHGAYAYSLPANPYPTVDNVFQTNPPHTPTSPSTGGISIEVASTDGRFLLWCPTGSQCMGTLPVVLFGDVEVPIDAVYSTANQLRVYSPPHPGGPVTVSVRNPDTRAATWSGTFTYTEVETGFTIELSRASGHVVVDWTGGPGGTRTIFRSPKPDFSVQLYQVSSAGEWTDPTTSGTDGYLYFYKVE